jgi:type I restriction enzyme S subunit
MTEGDGIPWVKISDATASNSRFIEKTSGKIKKDGASRSVEVFQGDLILSNSATLGMPRFMGINACIHDGWLLLRNFRGATKEYLYY